MTRNRRKEKPKPPLHSFFVASSSSSKIQELRVSKDVDGRRTPASGAIAGHKGDVETTSFLIDAKLTEKKRYSLSEKVLAKIDKEALAYGRIPALVIEFTTFRFGVTNKWAVIPYSVFVKIAKSEKREG